MENNINEYKYLFNNEEKRTTIIKEFEQNLNTYILETESIWKETKTIEKGSNKFNEYSQKVLEELQKLNNELRKMSESKSESYKKDVEFLLNLERENYKITLSIYLNKLKCFELLTNDWNELYMLFTPINKNEFVFVEVSIFLSFSSYLLSKIFFLSLLIFINIFINQDIFLSSLILSR